MWSGGFVSVWMFLWNKNIWMEMGNKEHTVLLFKRCFLFWPEPGTRDWGSTAGYLQGVSPGHHTQGQANPGTGQTIKTLMNVPSDSSSKRPSQGCHWNLRTLEVAFIPCTETGFVAPSPVAREEETLCLLPSLTSRDNWEVLLPCHPGLHRKMKCQSALLREDSQ